MTAAPQLWPQVFLDRNVLRIYRRNSENISNQDSPGYWYVRFRVGREWWYVRFRVGREWCRLLLYRTTKYVFQNFGRGQLPGCSRTRRSMSPVNARKRKRKQFTFQRRGGHDSRLTFFASGSGFAWAAQALASDAITQTATGARASFQATHTPSSSHTFWNKKYHRAFHLLLVTWDTEGKTWTTWGRERYFAAFTKCGTCRHEARHQRV